MLAPVLRPSAAHASPAVLLIAPLSVLTQAQRKLTRQASALAARVGLWCALLMATPHGFAAGSIGVLVQHSVEGAAAVLSFAHRRNMDQAAELIVADQ